MHGLSLEKGLSEIHRLAGATWTLPPGTRGLPAVRREVLLLFTVLQQKIYKKNELDASFLSTTATVDEERTVCLFSPVEAMFATSSSCELTSMGGS